MPERAERIAATPVAIEAALARRRAEFAAAHLAAIYEEGVAEGLRRAQALHLRAVGAIADRLAAQELQRADRLAEYRIQREARRSAARFPPGGGLRLRAMALEEASSLRAIARRSPPCAPPTKP